MTIAANWTALFNRLRLSLVSRKIEGRLSVAPATLCVFHCAMRACMGVPIVSFARMLQARMRPTFGFVSPDTSGGADGIRQGLNIACADVSAQ